MEVINNTMEELVSVIMPSYNSSKYIKDSVESVLNQTYKNIELIIVDDCSTDDTVDIINSCKDKRIRLFINEQNQGAALSRNKALREAQGKYIAFLDSDDIWVNNKLEKQIKFMQERDYSFTYTDYRICNNGKWENVIRTAPNVMNYRKIINYCYIFTSTIVYEREKIGLIQIQDLKKNNDYAMWLHALKNNNGHRLPECLSYYIKHDENSISSGNKFKLIKYHYQLFRKELNKTKFIAFWMTINNLWHGFWKKIFYKKRIKNNVN